MEVISLHEEIVGFQCLRQSMTYDNSKYVFYSISDKTLAANQLSDQKIILKFTVFLNCLLFLSMTEVYKIIY